MSNGEYLPTFRRVVISRPASSYLHPPTIYNNFSLLLGNVQPTQLKLRNVATLPNALTKNGLGILVGVGRFLHHVIARKEIGRGHRPVARQRLQLIKQDD